MRLLLIENNLIQYNSLKSDLELAGYAVDTVTDATEGKHLGMSGDYDIIILDLCLPKQSGLEVLEFWRNNDNKTPVIALTDNDAWHKKVEGFKAGADDSLSRPFYTLELLARMGAILKRAYGINQLGFEVYNVALNEEMQIATVNGEHTVELTKIEFRLLRYLMLNRDKVLSASELRTHIYNNDSEPDSNVIEVYINRLRSKLGQDLIATRRGQGYVFG